MNHRARRTRRRRGSGRLLVVKGRTRPRSSDPTVDAMRVSWRAFGRALRGDPRDESVKVILEALAHCLIGPGDLGRLASEARKVIGEGKRDPLRHVSALISFARLWRRPLPGDPANDAPRTTFVRFAVRIVREGSLLRGDVTIAEMRRALRPMLDKLVTLGDRDEEHFARAVLVAAGWTAKAATNKIASAVGHVDRQAQSRAKR